MLGQLANSLDVGRTLSVLADPDASAAAGSAAALVGAMAAAVVTKAARASGDQASSAQAIALGGRLEALAVRDAEMLDVARQALAQAGDGGDDRRDFGLGQTLRSAADLALEIAEACADVALLAVGLSDASAGDLGPDCQSAGWLAASAARAAAHLVEVNLAVLPDDAVAVRARRAGVLLPL
jgi:formiminotetrahydrofolate cyclodeaminase